MAVIRPTIWQTREESLLSLRRHYSLLLNGIPLACHQSLLSLLSSTFVFVPFIWIIVLFHSQEVSLAKGRVSALVPVFRHLSVICRRAPQIRQKRMKTTSPLNSVLSPTAFFPTTNNAINTISASKYAIPNIMFRFIAFSISQHLQRIHLIFIFRFYSEK